MTESKINIWDTLPPGFLVLAPMEAVTDTIFRRVVMRAGRPDIFFTEFTNADGWCSAGREAVGKRLEHLDVERPLIAQIWGAKPENIKKMAIDIAGLGFDGIDINMGCPEGSAVASGACAGLIRNPGLASEIIAAAKCGGLPVSVKTRLGYSKPEEYQEWLAHILKQDVAALSVHLRTKKEMSKVSAHYELLAGIKKLRDEIAPNTKLIANGDIADRAHAQELRAEYQFDGAMIGRGIFTNIFCFNNDAVVRGKEDLLALLEYHLDLFEHELTLNPKRKFDPLKRFFKIYIHGFDGASEMRARLMECRSLDEVRAMLMLK